MWWYLELGAFERGLGHESELINGIWGLTFAKELASSLSTMWEDSNKSEVYNLEESSHQDLLRDQISVF
jgi:hypothetical protein